MKIASAALSFAFIASLAAADPQTIRGLVRAPVGVDRAKLTATLFEGQPVECETDWKPLAEFAVDAKGEFSATIEATDATQIEIAGPGVRRARFPWPADVAGDEKARATFDMEGGWSIDGIVLDQATGAPLANVLVGPVAPGSDSGEDTMGVAFPFYTRTDADGRFALHGLAAPTSWEIPFFAEGHHRQRLQTVPGTPMRVELAPGGRALAGTMVGSRNAEPMPDRMILLRGGPRSFHIIRRTDDAGTFRFDGLPAGEYDLSSFSPSAGTGPTQSMLLTAEADIEGLVVFWPEGIRVAGTARDIETGDAVPGATLTIRESLVYSNAEGGFEFPLVEAPWPVTIGMDHPEFRLVPEDQPTDRWPINGSDAVDVEGLELKLRRKRILEVALSDPLLADLPPELQRISGAFELHGPVPLLDAIPVARHRIDLGTTVVPLESAGTRGALLRTSDGKASDLVFVETDIRQTTTTLSLALDQGGSIAGSLRYDAEIPPKLPAAPQFTAKLEAAFPGSTDRWIEIAQANPTPDGAFKMDALPPGEFRIRLLRPEGDPWIEETVTIARGVPVAFDRTVPRGAAVAGKVSSEDGLPLREVTVSAYGDDPMGRPLHLKSVSDVDGRFKFEGLGGSVVREISASHAIHGDGRLADVPVPNESIDLVLQPPAGIIVELAPGFESNEALLLGGTLRSAADGGTQWFYEVESRAGFGEEGTATLRPRNTSRLRVAARSGGLWDVSAPFEWTPSRGETRVVLEPSSTSAVEVEVTGVEPDALQELQVLLINTAVPETLANLEYDRPQVDGRKLVFPGIPAGEYMLIASGPGGETAVVNNLDVRRGETLPTTVDLSPPDIELAGRVVSGGAGVGGLAVRLRFADVPEAAVLIETTSGSDGEFSLFPLQAARSYLVEVAEGSDGRTWRVDVPAGSPKVFEREFPYSSPVEVQMAWPQSLSPRLGAGIPAILRNMEASSAQVVRDPGNGTTLRLMPGRYEVSLGEEAVGFMDVPAAGGTAHVIAE